MKRILTLTSILIALLLAIYFIEERPSQDKWQRDAKSALNFQEMGELKAIRLPKAKLRKVKDHFISEDSQIPLSDQRVEELLSIMSQIKALRFIPEDEVIKSGTAFFFDTDQLKMELEFEKGKVNIFLGKKLEYEKSFYLMIERNQKRHVMVAFDDSIQEGLVEKEDEHRSDLKYRRFLSLFFLTDLYFYKTQIFDTFSCSRVKVQTLKNIPFEIDLSQNVTNPVPYKSVSYLLQNFKGYSDFWSNLNAQTIYFPFRVELLKDKIGEMVFSNCGQGDVKLELFREFGSLKGVFIKKNGSQFLYEMKSEDSRYFFINVQDFWNKSLVMTDEIVDFHFQSRPSISVQISNGDFFSATSQANEWEAIHGPFKKLVDQLSEQAMFITEEKSSASGDRLEFVRRGQKFQMYYEDNELKVLNLTNNIVYHFYNGKKGQLPFSFESYFRKK